MRKRLVPSLLMLALVLGVLPSCAEKSTDISVAGKARADLVRIEALSAASGIQTQPPASRTVTSPPEWPGPRAAGRVVWVGVRAGDSVRAGQVIARLDDRNERLGLQQALAQRRVARAQVAVLSDRISEVRRKRADLRKTRRQLEDAVKTIRSKRVQLVTALAQARAAKAKIDAAKRAIARRPLPPGAPGPGSLPGSGTVPPGGVPKPPAFPNLAPVIAKLEAGLKLLDAKLVQVESGLRKLRSAQAKLADAEKALKDGRDLARVFAQGQDATVQLAAARLTVDSLRSPVDGIVVDAVPAGTIVMQGTPVVTVRPSAETLVETYLTAGQASLVATGAAASVTADSLPGSLRGTVVSISAEDDFPPTSFAALGSPKLTRARKVTVRLERGSVPPGTPCDVLIRPGQNR